MTSYTIGGVPLITYGFIGITAAILGSVHILDKDDESIFILNDCVIKFFYNKKIVKNRMGIV